MMNMIQYILIPGIVVFLMIALISWSGGSETCSRHEGHELVFRVSERMRIVIALIGFFFSCFGITGFLFAPVANVFLLSLGGLFATLCFVETWRMRRARVVISNDSLTYYRGFGSRAEKIKLAAIKSVVVANGYITIDSGMIPRLVIPAYFSRMHHLVELLEAGSGGGVSPEWH